MHRKFITLIVATAIAVTGFSAPARAGGEDAGKMLAGLAALAILGAVIHESRKDRVVVTRDYRPLAPPRHQRVQPRPLPRAVSRNILPRECLRTFESGYGTKTRMFGRKCMKTHYSYTNDLPRECKTRIWGPTGERRGFNPQCLRRQGYRAAHN